MQKLKSAVIQNTFVTFSDHLLICQLHVLGVHNKNPGLYTQAWLHKLETDRLVGQNVPETIANIASINLGQEGGSCSRLGTECSAYVLYKYQL